MREHKGARRVQAHHAQGPRIHQRHPYAIGRFQAHPLVARGRLAHTAELPVAGHPEVDLENGPALQMHQLDLRSAFHALNGEPHGGPRGLLRQMALLGGVQGLEAGDDAPSHRGTQPRGGEFDFGQLGHTTGAKTGGED